MNRFDRTEKLIGADKLEKLKSKSVLIIGLGGVGGYAFEMLVRSGIGRFTLVDGDRVDITNINRQILALDRTVGVPKVSAAAERAKQINDQASVLPLETRYCTETAEKIFGADKFDYCIDCFDSVKEKIHFLSECEKRNLKVISACGAGNRIAPEYKVDNIAKTHSDPLARAVRRGLKDVDTRNIKAVFDVNESINAAEGAERTPASISYAPALMGCLIGAEVIKDLLNDGETE